MSAPLPGSLEALRLRHGARLRWWMLLSVMIGAMAAAMASTIVNVAVADMSRAFTLTPARAQWLSASFMATMTMGMLTTPWLMQRLGYRRAAISGVLLLMAGALLGGLSPWFGLVMAMRAVEGLAAGILQPIPAIIVMRAFAPGEQGRAMGLFSFGVVLAPAVGPSIGGVLVEWFGWRSIFFVVLPLGLVALPLLQRFLPINAPGGAMPGPGRRFDLPGLVLLSAAMLSLLNGLVHLHDPTPGLWLGLLGSASAAWLAFAAWQRRTPDPLLPPGIFRHGQLALGSAVGFFYGMALFGSTYLVPVFMLSGLHLPPSQAGAVLLPAGLMLALTSPVGGRLADRYPVHLIIVAGLVLMALSFMGTGQVGLGSGLLLIVGWTVIGRIGLGLILPSLNVSALRAVAPEHLSSGASAINFVRQLGGTVGISLVGVILEWRLAARGLDPADLATPSATALGAFQETFIALAALTVIAMVPAWRMQDRPAVNADGPVEERPKAASPPPHGG